MKKGLLGMLAIILVSSMFLAGCNKGSSDKGYSNGGKGTKIELWTFNELHEQYYEHMAEKWNEENPDDQISLKATTYPYEDLHNKLLVALQSGKGAPDISDVEISKFGNFLKGEPQILPLDDVIDPEKENIVQSRLDIYAKDGKTYGIDFHVGAAVIYYNKEIMDKAGVNPDDIKTWADYKEAGKTVLEKTGIPMTTLDIEDQWSFWPQVAQLEGKDDLLKENGEVNLTDPRIVEVLQYEQDLVKEGIAIPSPGNDHHSEEYYGFMNNGGAASVWMPMWYMGRFTDYMPDLKGKIVIKPMPAWSEGAPRSAGMGGTGTVVTNQSKDPDVAKKFLAYAKLSKEGNIEIWKQLGFDPIRSDVWDLPEVNEENKFTEYFGPNIFSTLLEVKDEIEGVNIGERTPDVSNAVKTTILFQTLVEMKDPKQALEEAASQIK
ncbi:ABC transporter substrate-binding protein [Niallia taxi]|uniref:ABC transporter substrate-binding protein n=1 Tax=Niallia taxi TaxID=2499688 RepID=UPI00119FDB37|nr:sugar ABC transporter substrate-binding protein [Niallia taxi]MCM3216441.1 sugar ABC transporter substrate-binding protein [Niallia taxi]MCT2344449.1 sugar ABC transporter substrate-binding protein [Niallia taxi]MDE5053891.1 sugar ABC transporter substrate-binding protein [Niallia taxi]MED3964082.1 sugar ABC transporter substrate-binding protein [Niallia taxi]WOD63523.1 sugar ABC transporter substrate-binding protein [Niallia taxi]